MGDKPWAHCDMSSDCMLSKLPNRGIFIRHQKSLSSQNCQTPVLLGVGAYDISGSSYHNSRMTSTTSSLPCVVNLSLLLIEGMGYPYVPRQ